MSENCSFCIKPGIPLRCLPEGQNEALVGTAATMCISTTLLMNFHLLRDYVNAFLEEAFC